MQLLLSVFPLARSKRAGGESASVDRGRDILGTPGWSVQVKRMARPNVYTALEEAARVAGPDEIPLALTRRDRGEWLATLPADHLVALLGQLEKLRRNFTEHLPPEPEDARDGRRADTA